VWVSVCLREIAERAVSPKDLKEDLIRSLQVHVEVDEPEPEAAHAPPARPVNIPRPDDQTSDAKIDRITEEELLQGLARSIPTDAERIKAEWYMGLTGSVSRPGA
jgi:DNA-directed RNA polymerase subunit omega